ncbi:MAG: T9SS type A sorting domain-containing protein [Bacteroidota bacterium]
MKTIQLLCCLFFLGSSTLFNAQTNRDLNDLLAELENNHMGAITDVFTSEELGILEAHFAAIRDEDPNNFDSRGPQIWLYGPENVGDDFGFIDSTDPSVFNFVGPSGTADFDGAGAIFPGNTTAHVIDNAGNMYEVDIETGIYTFAGTVNPPAGENFTGLEFNPNTGALMGISTDGTTNTSTLSSIDPVTMGVTPIGNTGLRLPIAISIDGNGNAFTYDIDDDILYQLNTSNGVPTALGPLGFNADFGGGMSYDPSTGKTFITSFNPAVGDSQLREVNTTNGMTTVIGTIQPGPTSQMAWTSAVNSDILGVGDVAFANFAFAPNPATGMLHFQANATIERVEVYNLLGQRILEQRIDDLKGVMDVTNLSTGSYLLSVVVEGRSGTYHFMKQ